MNKEELISYLNNIDFENSNIVYNEIEKLAKEYQQEMKKVAIQQKEFIKYLEEELNFYKMNTQGYSMNLVEEILQKYKSIIGGRNE